MLARWDESTALVIARPFVPILPELTLALMLAGVLEQTRRELATASLIAKLALGVAVVSLAVAIITVLAS